MPIVLARIIYGAWTLLIAASLTSNVMRYLERKGYLPKEQEQEIGKIEVKENTNVQKKTSKKANHATAKLGKAKSGKTGKTKA